MTDKIRWTDAEIALLREHYPAGGIRACRPVLPGRTAAAIRNAAYKQGLHYGQYGRHPQIRWPEHIDAQIRRLYLNPIRTGDTRKLAARIGYSPARIKHRARQLGLAIPRECEPEWSEHELAILERCQGQHPRTVKKRLAAAGFRRTVDAITVKRKRTGLTGTADGTYTGGRLAVLLGIDNSTVAKWCRQGLIRATRRGTDRTHLSDDWLITDAAVRQFIIDYPAHLDLRKIEVAHSKFWLIDLLTGRTGAKAPGREDVA